MSLRKKESIPSIKSIKNTDKQGHGLKGKVT